MLLGVYLDTEPVGEVSVRGESTEFRLFEAYRNRYPRRVLGQVFEDDLERVHRSRVKLPPFFSNLLPEGALRELLTKQIGVKAEREPELLAYLGDDLPGAVRVAVEDGVAEGADDEIDEGSAEEPDDGLKFSLAGMQLKFSALREGDRGLTIRAHGRGGDWIVKLPDPRFPGVPENEWTMMTLARQAGLDVADVELVPVGKIAGLPSGLRVDFSANALTVKRFDRGPGGTRVHIEDFAQVLDVRPSHREKYKSANFETLGRIVARVAPESKHEFLRRIVFNVAVGNGDAHIKNWALRYGDGIHPSLSPAYDLVSTVQYIQGDDLGLNLARNKQFYEVRLASFRHLDQKAELGVDVESVVRETVARVRDAWKAMRSSVPISDVEKDTLEEHWSRIPMMNGA
jgi:serine/threonine-protein kinase HipA